MKKFFQILFPKKEIQIQEAIDRIEYQVNLYKMEIEGLEQELKFLKRSLHEIKNQK